jgi:hypothetical protein
MVVVIDVFRVSIIMQCDGFLIEQKVYVHLMNIGSVDKAAGLVNEVVIDSDHKDLLIKTDASITPPEACANPHLYLLRPTAQLC